MKTIIFNDVTYGDHERQRVDIFIPEKVKNVSGLILFIHGGGWVDGDKTVHHPDAQFFCNLGYVVASMNYRYVSENINIFDELDDITSALKAVKNKCFSHGLKPRRLILSGGSAGAHLSLMYAYTRQNEAPVTPVAVCAYCPGVNCAKPDFLLGISGEFEDWKYGVLSKACGTAVTKSDLLNIQQQTALLKISPEKYVSSDCVPTAVFHGRHDELVPLEQIKCFMDLLDSTGVKNDFLLYENSNHALDKDPETALQAKNIIKSYAEMYF